MSTKTTKKAVTRKVQPKKAQPEVTPMPKLAARRARGASKVAEAAARRPVPQPPVKADAKRVSGDAIPAVSIATMTAPDRIKAAKAEHETMKVWAANGKKGDPPATPVLAWLGENPSGSVQRKSQVRKAKRGGDASSRSSGVCTVVFVANGKDKAASAQKLFCLAYDHTADVDPATPKRISGADLRALLAAAGVTEPETTEWELKLSNGQTIGARKA